MWLQSPRVSAQDSRCLRIQAPPTMPQAGTQTLRCAVHNSSRCPWAMHQTQSTRGARGIKLASASPTPWKNQRNICKKTGAICYELWSLETISWTHPEADKPPDCSAQVHFLPMKISASRPTQRLYALVISCPPFLPRVQELQAQHRLFVVCPESSTHFTPMSTSTHLRCTP